MRVFLRGGKSLFPLWASAQRHRNLEPASLQLQAQAGRGGAVECL